MKVPTLLAGVGIFIWMDIILTLVSNMYRLISAAAAHLPFLIKEDRPHKFRRLQNTGGPEVILIAPEITGASPGVGTLVEIHALGMVELAEAIIPAGIEPKLQLMLSGLGVNRESLGRKGDISAVFAIEKHFDDAAAVMGNAERKVRFGAYFYKIADGSGIEGQALGDDISPANS